MKVVSLFSGAGGLDLGFNRVGHEIVWANDNYADACETYRINLGSHIFHGDIEQVSFKDIPDCDIVIGGFPCQGFSVANMKRHISDKRNQLYLEFLRLLKDKKPKFFVAENVKGLLSMNKGLVLKRIIKDFSKVGYDVEYKLLNAADFGVPQTRERVIIIGALKEMKETILFPSPTHFPTEYAKKHRKRRWLSVGTALKRIPDPDKPNNLTYHTYSTFKLNFNGYLGNRVIDPNKPAPTVTGRGDNKGGVVVLHHPNNQRRMTARELAIVQSFPKDYKFFGCRSSVYRQIANAVPPLMAEAIAKQFLNKEI